ncbi:hypothetical protein [Hyphomonas beringensis]|uniref:hypothetical protein n=1 Tax=Hyphomonas beringensis TaxID=1280946 RepID=UPI0012DC2F18|nr:hypothetical protein [Hyphomonas beringensis]
MNKINLIEEKTPHWKDLWFESTGWHHTPSDASCPMRAAHLGTHLRKTPHVRPVPQRTRFAPAHDVPCHSVQSWIPRRLGRRG